MPDVVNIAGYQFLPLTEISALREQLRERCKVWRLRGTILLSPEGINLVVAGGRVEIDALLQELRAISGLETFCPKLSVSEEQPFNRMLVRIKKEIIAFGVPGIEPCRRTSPKLAPKELKRWLDEGRPITLLDTRNDYEVKLGTFRNAVTLGIEHFRSFPDAVDRLPDGLKQQPIVMFCTGGIRCEKAGPYMEHAGYEQIFQLDGGILKYFEECGSAHYEGECFVFDRRVGLDPKLAKSGNSLCFHCLTPLTTADQQDKRYVTGRSCPFCYVADDERLVRTLAERDLAIQQATIPLPGSEPYENVRPLKIAAKHNGLTLLQAIGQMFPHLDPNYWRGQFAQQLILDDTHQAVGPERRVLPGQRYLHLMPVSSEPAVNANIRVLHEDSALVVVNKPAPLPLHPSGRFNRNSLQWILNKVYHPQNLRPVHRLDANTTGLVVFARTRHFAGQLQPQLAAGTVDKNYLARIHGHPPEDSFVCDAPIGRTTTDLDGRAIDEQGLPAHTEFCVLFRFDDGTSLIAARPITGRTNQIRLHLWHLGWPICGEQAYLPNQRLGRTQTHEAADPPLCLHAQRISFIHPLTNERATFEAAGPSWSETRSA